MTAEELQQAGDNWKQVHLNTVISKWNTAKNLNIPEYDLKGVKCKIHMKREVVIPPFTTIVVKGVEKLMTHSKCVNVVIRPVIGYLDHIATARSYGVLRPGVGKIQVGPA